MILSAGIALIGSLMVAVVGMLLLQPHTLTGQQRIGFYLLYLGSTVYGVCIGRFVWMRR